MRQDGYTWGAHRVHIFRYKQGYIIDCTKDTHVYLCTGEELELEGRVNFESWVIVEAKK